MKHLIALIPLACASLLLGCQTTGAERAASTVMTMEQLQTELRSGKTDVKNVVGSLNQLGSENVDMRKQYETFTLAVDHLEGQAALVRGLREDMEEREADFVEAWAERLETISDPELRQRAAERRTEAVQTFDAIELQADGARGLFEAWMSDVRDVRTYLDNELNAAGVASVADIIARITEGAPAIENEIDELVAVLDSVAASIAAASAAAADSAVGDAP